MLKGELGAMSFHYQRNFNLPVQVRLPQAFYSLIAIFLLSSSVAQAGSLPRIEWKLAFPFRLVHSADGGDWSSFRNLYVHRDCMGNPNPVHCSELKLGLHRVNRLRNLTKSGRDNGALIRKLVGWTRYYRQREAHYGHNIPRRKPVISRKIKVRLTGSKPRMRCWWTVSHNTQTRVGRCTKWQYLDLPTAGSKIVVSWRREHAPAEVPFATLSLTSDKTRIRPFTIVGLGDSFASGEGNPDVPANLDFTDPKNPTRPPPGKGIKKAQANNHDAAAWLDRNCHRSFMGPQMRAAIQFAANHPRMETIFIGVSCSGATIDRGIIGPYEGTTETSAHTRKMYDNKEQHQADKSQINQVVELLCDYGKMRRLRDLADEAYQRRFTAKYLNDKANYERQPAVDHPCPEVGGPIRYVRDEVRLHNDIDAVLLSIGGNDIGFGRVIKDALLGPLEHLVTRVAVPEEVMHPLASYNKIIGELPGIYERLDEAIRNRLNIQQRRKVVISVYPNPTRDHDGVLCAFNEGLGRFDLIPTPYLSIFKSRIRKIESDYMERYVLLPLNRAVRTAAALKPDDKWRIADSHYKRSETRGLCAARDRAELTAHGWGWNPYAKTTRLFRLPDDSWHLQNQLHHDIELADVVRPLQWIVRNGLKNYGTIHPNNFGAAMLADAYLEHLEAIWSKK